MKPMYLNKRLTPLAIAVSLALTPATSIAQEMKQSDKEQIEALVVVGQATNTEITAEDLEKYQANNLSEIFRQDPAVTVGGTGIAQKIFVRGLEDTQLNVTVDGAPQTSSLFHHVGRVSIEPELLQAVEVQAGAGEATSGAGAIGGSIRFKTKNVDDLLEDDKQFGGMIKAGYFSNDGLKTSGTLYGKLNDNWGLLGSYVKVDSDNIEDGKGNEIFGTAAEQSMGFVKINGELSDNQTISLSYENRVEEGELSSKPNWVILEGATLYPITGERDTLVFNHQWLASELVNLETSIYHTQSSVTQDGRWGLFEGQVKSHGFDIRNTSHLAAHSLTYGLEYRKDTVDSGSLEPGGGEEAQETGTVAGLYIQDHWQLHDDLLLSFGLRYDQYDLEQQNTGSTIDSDGFSPNVGLNYDINNNWQINLSYAQAMRGKEVGDAFTLNGAVIDPELAAEEVENTEIGLIYQQDNWQVSAAVYQSDIDNVILDQNGQGTYYENVGTLKTKGFELKANYWYQGLELGASFSHNDIKLNGDDVEGYEHVGLGNARGDTWGLNVNYALSNDIEFGWHFSYVEDLNNLEVLQRAIELGWTDATLMLDKDGYQVHDVYVQWLPLSNDTLTVNLTVKNLFDEQYLDHSSVGDYSEVFATVSGVYEAGRDVRLSLSYKF